MKTIILLIFSGYIIFAQDVRIVSSIKVDLQPIHDWAKKEKGERPLKHWRLVEIHECVRNMGAGEQCAVKIKDDEKTILIANLPPQVKAHFQKLETLGKRIEDLTSYIDAEGKRVSYLDATTPTGVAGNAVYVDAVMKKRYQVNVDALNLGEKQKEAERLSKEWIEESKKIPTDLAMFTGRKYAGMEIWDVGLKVAN